MLYKFSEFDPNEHFVVAPEGLSRFYLKGFGGEVVASWMTKRDRLHEIADFSNYLNSLYTHYTNQLSDGAQKVVLGFSQGGTTCYRWLHQKQVILDYLISYSCWIPEDIDLKASKTVLNQINQHIFTYGKRDEFLTEDRMKKVKSIVKQNNLDLVIEAYDGIHRIEKVQLKALFENYMIKTKD